MATHALTGVPAVDAATATSFGDLYVRGRWDKEALDGLGVVEDQLPVVGQMGAALGRLPGSPTAFAGGSIDAFCEQIVAGANQPGDVLAIFGATLIVWVVTDEWKDVPGLTTLPTMVAGQVMIGGPSNAGALFADWVRHGGGLPVAAPGGSAGRRRGRTGRRPGGGAGVASLPARGADPVPRPRAQGQRARSRHLPGPGVTGPRRP